MFKDLDQYYSTSSDSRHWIKQHLLLLQTIHHHEFHQVSISPTLNIQIFRMNIVLAAFTTYM